MNWSEKTLSFNFSLLFTGKWRSSFPNFSLELNQNIDYGHQEPGMSGSLQQPAYQVRMLSALQKFQGRALIILSGNDLTAAEFKQMVSSNRRWRKLIKRSSISWFEMPDANHTFSTREWRDIVAETTVQWLRSE